MRFDPDKLRPEIGCVGHREEANLPLKGRLNFKGNDFRHCDLAQILVVFPH
jgi:hypothetical protein